MKETDYKDHLKHARELSTADNTLPKEAEANYRGPDALGQSLLRGTLFGTTGWFAGKWFGQIGTKHKFTFDGNLNPKYHDLKPKGAGVALAFLGVIFGAYSGGKDARFFKKQVDDLQGVVKKQNTKIGDLQKELKSQLNGEGKLKEYNPSWEKETEEKERPVTKVASEGAEHTAPAAREAELA